jgi:nitrite reductase/ring-hydroxylating ferredoxin subunit
MSVLYTPVQWNRAKWVYDAVMVGAVALYLIIFLKVAPAYTDATRPVDGAILRMRAFGSCAFLMLTVILCIGPLAKLDRRWMPLLYNRRHFGVLTAVIATIHAMHVLDWYYAFSPTPKLEGLLAANTSFGQVLGFPFELFGVAALIILWLLAATSHDFWLSFLTAPVWKRLHFLIYIAYAAVVAHVALGYLQDADNPFFAGVVFLGAGSVIGLHIAAARKERSDTRSEDRDTGDWVQVCRWDEIPEKRARIVRLGPNERAAVFRYDGKVSAVSNACAHQNGPLGEGRIIYDCVTCPWHGFQYDPASGCSPAPFTEKIPTYRIKMADGAIWLDPQASPPGTFVEPIKLPEGA